MKKIITIIVSIIFVIEANAQTDIIRLNTFNILKTNDPIVNFRYLSRKELVIAEMGKPTIIKRLNWETLTEDVDKYV